MTDGTGHGTAAGGGTAPADRTAPADGTTPAHVHVVRGTPDDVELAALVAGLAAVAVDHGDGDAAPRSAWCDRSRALRGPRPAAAPAPDAWRWSLRG